ncbi:MAG: single-stranded DNA-binding protein [Bacillota bacterium]
MLNRIILIGRLVRDPELRYTSSGTPVSNFTLAVERNYKNKQGERDVDFIKIVTWRKLAETCAQHLGKGRMVAVEGRLQIRKSQNENRTYINPEVIAENVQFLDWPGDNSQKRKMNNNMNNNMNDQNRNMNNQNNYSSSNNDQDNFEEDEDFDVPF